MERESGVTRSIIDDFHSSVIQGDLMEGQSCVTISIIDEPHSPAPVKWKVKVVLLKGALINFILRISKEIKWKVEVVLLQVLLMNFILP